MNAGLIEQLEKAWVDFLDANPDDLTSPEDLPNHALMTCQQFVRYASEAIESAPPSELKAEVTPEMLRAGASALLPFGSDPPNDELAAAYLAMKALDPEVERMRDGLNKVAFHAVVNCSGEEAATKLRAIREIALAGLAGRAK